MKEILPKIVDLIRAEWPDNVPHDGFTPATKLFYEGVGLDSIDGVTLVLSIEERFGVQIDPAQVPPQAFENLESLCAFVRACLGAEP